MADYCVFCDTRRPSCGTNMLVLGDQWLEFCVYCGETEMLTNAETGAVMCIADVFELGGQKLKNRPDKAVADGWRKAKADREKAVMLRKQREAERKAAARAKLRGGCGNGPLNFAVVTPAG